MFCLQESFNINISQQLFEYTKFTALENNIKGDFVLKNRV